MRNFICDDLMHMIVLSWPLCFLAPELLELLYFIFYTLWFLKNFRSWLVDDLLRLNWHCVSKLGRMDGWRYMGLITLMIFFSGSV